MDSDTDRARKNGILIQGKSHKRKDLEWGKKTETIRKPILRTKIDEHTMTLADTPPGWGVIFDDKLLHGGALNTADKCRCSIEFTLLKKI